MTSSIVVRKATAADGTDAVPLLLAAGDPLLVNVFGLGDEDQALSYLQYAWQYGSGQYGFKNHFVATLDEKVVGLICGWHSRLPKDFDRATLSSITDHYGLDGAIDVVMRGQVYMATLEPPMATELCVGHLAVHRSARRKGVGRMLLEHMHDYAHSLKKNALVLNVLSDNDSAVSFYQRCGFGVHQTTPPFVQLIRVVKHLGEEIQNRFSSF